MIVVILLLFLPWFGLLVGCLPNYFSISANNDL